MSPFVLSSAHTSDGIGWFSHSMHWLASSAVPKPQMTLLTIGWASCEKTVCF
jgi:hypothetical protein